MHQGRLKGDAEALSEERTVAVGENIPSTIQRLSMSDFLFYDTRLRIKYLTCDLFSATGLCRVVRII